MNRIRASLMSGFRGSAALPGARRLLLGSLAAAVLPFSAVTGQASEWNKKGGGDWSAGNNWVPAGAPDDKKVKVVFPSVIAAKATISVDKTYSLDSLTINDDNGFGYIIQSSSNSQAGVSPKSHCWVEKVFVRSIF